METNSTILLPAGYKWEAKIVKNVDGAIREPLEKSNFNTESGSSQDEAFIRELCQNALDAKNPSNNKPVFIEIKEQFLGNTEEERNAYENLLSSELIQYLTDSGDIENQQSLTYKCLRISDFNTLGLDGNPSYVSSNFHKYFFKVGDKGKLSKKGKLGSANIGKVATWALSRFWTVFVRSMLSTEEKKIIFAGRCLLKKNTDIGGGETRLCDAFYRKDLYDYTISQEEDKLLESIIMKNSRQEQGTDFLLPENHDLDKNKLIQHTLKNWFPAISENKLEMNILEERIQSSSLKSLIKRYGTGCPGLDQEMIDFVAKARQQNTPDSEIIQMKIKENVSRTVFDANKYAFNEQMIEGPITQGKDILNAFNDYKLIKLEVPIMIQMADGSESRDSFFVSIQKRRRQNQSQTFGLMMRDLQILWDEKKFYGAAKNSDQKTMVCTISNNSDVNDLLTHFEKPSHMSFDSEIFNGEDIYKIGRSKFILELFRRSADRFINYVFQSDNEPDSSLLSDLFPKNNQNSQSAGKGEKTKRTKPKNDDQPNDDKPDDDDDPVPPTRSLFIQEQNGGTLILRCNGEGLPKDKVLTITIGIQGISNPFNVSPFDINLKRLNVSTRDCLRNHKKTTHNSIQITTTGPQPSITIEKLWENWSYISKYQIED